MPQQARTPRHGDQPRSTITNPFVYFVSVFVLVVVVVGLIFMIDFIGDSRGGSNQDFGSYDNVSITMNQDSYMYRQYSYLDQRSNGGDPMQKARNLKQAFDSTVFHVASLAKARELGIGASDAAIYRTMAREPQFQDAKGNLNPAAVAAYPELKSLMDSIRSDLIQNRLFSQVLSASLPSENEQNFIASTYAQRRAMDVVIFDKVDYPDSEVIAYAKAHPELFSQVHLAVITVESSDLATRIRKDIDANPASFEALAQANSIDEFKDKGGVQDPYFTYTIPYRYSDATIAKQVSELKTNQIAGPFGVDNKFQIVKSIADPVVPAFDNPAAIAVVRDYIASNERGMMEDFLLKQAREFTSAARNNGFAAEASTRSKTVLSTQPFALNLVKRDGIDPFMINTMYGPMPLLSSSISLSNNQILAGASEREEFILKAWKLKSGEVSEPVALSGQVVVMSLNAETPAPEMEASILKSYLPNMISDLGNADLRRVVIDNKLLKDRFDDAYYRYQQGADAN